MVRRPGSQQPVRPPTTPENRPLAQGRPSAKKAPSLCVRGPAAAPRVPACNVAAATPPLAIQVGRANYTTSERLLRTGALTPQTLAMLQSYFRPHNDALHAMFPHSQFW